MCIVWQSSQESFTVLIYIHDHLLHSGWENWQFATQLQLLSMKGSLFCQTCCNKGTGTQIFFFCFIRKTNIPLRQSIGTETKFYSKIPWQSFHYSASGLAPSLATCICMYIVVKDQQNICMYNQYIYNEMNTLQGTYLFFKTRISSFCRNYK